MTQFQAWCKASPNYLRIFQHRGPPLNKGDSSYLGYPMFVKKKFKKKNTPKEFCHSSYEKKYTNILGDFIYIFFNLLKLFGKQYSCVKCWGTYGQFFNPIFLPNFTD